MPELGETDLLAAAVQRNLSWPTTWIYIYIYNAQGTYFSEGKMLTLRKQTTHNMGLSNDSDDNNNNNKY